MDRQTQVLDEFKTDATRIEHLLLFIKDFREFGASTPASSLNVSEDWPEAGSLLATSKNRRTDLPYLSGSLFLYLAGRFEYFVKQLVEVTAEEMTDRVGGYANLPAQLRNEVRRCSLDVIQNPRRFGFDDQEADALLLNVAEATKSGSHNASIPRGVLTITEANIKDRVLADLMKRVCLDSVWKEIGKQAALKLVLEKRSDGDATREAQSRLNTLMEDRNQIAHPTPSTTFPDPDQVLKSHTFLVVLAEVLTQLTQVHLSNSCPPNEAT